MRVLPPAISGVRLATGGWLAAAFWLALCALSVRPPWLPVCAGVWLLACVVVWLLACVVVWLLPVLAAGVLPGVAVAATTFTGAL